MADGPQFNVDGARQAGYSDDEILNHLAQSRNFDVNGALKSGYSKADIITHLQSAPPPAPNLTTGAGMENYAQQQAHWVVSIDPQGNYSSTGQKISGPNGEPLSYMDKAAQDQANQQVKLRSAANRASLSPTPFTNASTIYAPVAAAKSIIGAKVGSRAGGAVADAIGVSPDTKQYFEAGGGLVGGLGGPLASRPTATSLRTSLAQKLVQPLVYEGVGEAGADARAGIDPARGLVREGLVGTKQGLVNKIGNRVGELKSAANDVLQGSRASNLPIDAAPAINSAVDEAIATARGQGQLDSIPRLESLRTALLTQHGSTNAPPLDINNLKSNIQDVASNLGAYRNTVPAEASAAGAAGKAASNIRGQVNEAVPEAAPLNNRMADVLDARAGLQRSVNADKGSNIFSGDLWSIPNRVMRNTIGSAPVRTGLARVLTTGMDRSVPQPGSPFPVSNPTPFAASATNQGNSGDFTRTQTRSRAQLIGPDGTQRINVLPTEHAGEGDYAGLLPGPQYPAAPPAPLPPVPQVGLPPTLGFSPVTPNPMWSGRATLVGPTWELPQSQPITTPGGRVAPPPPPTLPSIEGAPSPQDTGILPIPPTAGQTALPPLPEPQPINPQEVADLQQETPRLMSPDRVNQYRREQASDANIRAGLTGNRADATGNIREAHRAKLESRKGPNR